METDVLAQLVAARLRLLVELHQLARRQADMIREGDMGRLLGLLAVKQNTMNELLAVDRQLDPFRAQEPEGRVWRSPDDRRRCREAAAHCETLLREITVLERSCESELVQRRDRTAELLQGMHVAAQATHAYGEMDRPSGGHFDMSCET